jgi:hypothetical protein
MIFRLKDQAAEKQEVNGCARGRDTTKKRGPQNEGISLWFAENKGHKKTTLPQFDANPKC